MGTAKPRPWVAIPTFLIVQAVLACWWAAFYPGLFSRDSVLYLSHTVVGPWVSDHSVLYDALLSLSFTKTGDLGAVTFAQTTAMAAALTYLAQSLKALGAPRLPTTLVAMLMPLAPPVGAFSVTLWKDVPFTICAIAVAGVCARIAARRAVTVPTLVGLGLLFTALGLFRANGFLVVGVAVLALLVIVTTMRVRLLLAGTFAAALPLVLTNFVFPQFGIMAPAKTYVYHTAFGDIAVAYRDHPELFTEQDKALMATVAPLTRWWDGGTCYTINPLIWRRDFSWPQADAHASELLDLWKRLLTSEPRMIIDTRLCRGAIAWRPVQDEFAIGGMTYRFSRRPNADTYVGPNKVPDFPGRWVFSLRPKSWELNQVADPWLTGALAPQYDWVLWRGALWAYASYLAVALGALALRNRYVLGVAAVVAGQQLTVLANISAQDFRYMASPIFVGVLLVPLLVGGGGRVVVASVRGVGRALRPKPRPALTPPGTPALAPNATDTIPDVLPTSPPAPGGPSAAGPAADGASAGEALPGEPTGDAPAPNAPSPAAPTPDAPSADAPTARGPDGRASEPGDAASLSEPVTPDLSPSNPGAPGEPEAPGGPGASGRRDDRE